MLANLDPVILARSSHAARIPSYFPEPGTIFFELCRTGQQHVAVAGPIRNFIPQGSRRSGISIVSADRNRYYAAFSTDLYGLMLLHIQRKSIP